MTDYEATVALMNKHNIPTTTTVSNTENCILLTVSSGTVKFDIDGNMLGVIKK